MSDRFSTPSQTQSTVSNDAFEALIDLLTSDGVDEKSSTHQRDRSRSQPNATLRDRSGKLDFDKIRLMFAAQNESPFISTPEDHLGEDLVQSPNEDGDSDDEQQSLRGTSSTVPSRSSSMSPQSVERAATGHKRSSTFGNQPWAAIHEHATGTKVEDGTPMPSDQPLSFDELNVALAGAHEEVRTLRQQCDELRALVSERMGTEARNRAQATPIVPNTDPGNARAETRDVISYVRPCAIAPSSPLPSDVPMEVATLSENEAKKALSTLARSLNLSLGVLGPLANSPTLAVSTPQQQGLHPPNPTRQHDVASINRAVKFLGTVDELVWRRASGPSGPRTLLPMYSEENFIALVSRLELWERAVRRSSRS